MRFSAGYMRASSEGVNCNDLLKKGRTRFITNAAFFYIINYYLLFLTAAAVRGERDGCPYLIFFSTFLHQLPEESDQLSLATKVPEMVL
jgi:hypothetical protein